MPEGAPKVFHHDPQIGPQFSHTRIHDHLIGTKGRSVERRRPLRTGEGSAQLLVVLETGQQQAADGHEQKEDHGEGHALFIDTFFKT